MAYEAKPRADVPSTSFADNNRKLELAIFGTTSQPESVPATSDPTVTSQPSSPLDVFSLRGAASEFEERATEAKPLLGDLCLRGQCTILYAQANAGKTLIALHLLLEAVKAGRIAADLSYYVNADDGSQGFAEKLRIADDAGIHTLAPGFKGFKAPELLSLLRRGAENGSARGQLVIIDTLKKFTSLMRKDDAAAFGDACRQFAMRGGSIVGLAHTTKNANVDGSPRYTGTTDLLEDFDAAYTLRPLDGSPDSTERVVEFKNLKRRGDNPEIAAYAYSTERSISYEELLLSVRPAEPGQLKAFQRAAEAVDDAAVIQAIESRILEGAVKGKMELASVVAERSGVSAKAVMRVLHRYTGGDPAVHRWRCQRGPRGALFYGLLAAS